MVVVVEYVCREGGAGAGMKEYKTQERLKGAVLIPLKMIYEQNK